MKEFVYINLKTSELVVSKMRITGNIYTHEGKFFRLLGDL
jgi:hypothetical protein